MDNAKNINTATVTLNPYGIAARAQTKLSDLQNRILIFCKSMILYLNSIETQRLEIDKDAFLTPEGKVDKLMKLQNQCDNGLDKFQTDAQDTMASIRKILVSMVETKLKYVGSQEPVETMKRIEAREDLEKLDNAELIELIHDEDTSDFLFRAILSAPLPMLSDDLLTKGVEIKIKSVAPEILEYRDGCLEVSTAISGAMQSAYRYVYKIVPRQDDFAPKNLTQKINFDMPDFVSILAKQ